MTIYPEHEKLEKIQEQSQAIGEFLEWISNVKHFVIGKWYLPNSVYEKLCPININKTELLAEYYEIDLNKIESEKRQMLESIRKRNEDG